MRPYKATWVLSVGGTAGWFEMGPTVEYVSPTLPVLVEERASWASQLIANEVFWQGNPSSLAAVQVSKLFSLGVPELGAWSFFPYTLGRLDIRQSRWKYPLV